MGGPVWNDLARSGEMRVVVALRAGFAPLMGMTSRRPSGESPAAVVTGVLVAAGGFHAVTGSGLVTAVVTALAVALAVLLPRRGPRARR